MSGWVLEDNQLRKDFSFASSTDAAKFAAASAHRASRSNHAVNINLNGHIAEIRVPPSADTFTRLDIQFARRLDLRPHGEHH